MSLAEMTAPPDDQIVGWAEICNRYSDEWVCLVDVDLEAAGSIRSAMVVGHHRSLGAALHQVGSWSPDRVVAYAHTGGRKRQLVRFG